VSYTPHILVTMGGSLSEVGATDEIWQIGVRGINPAATPSTGTVPGSTNLEAMLGEQAVLPGVSGWFTAGSSFNANTAHLGWMKAAFINGAGAYAAAPEIFDFGTGPVGGGTPTMPSFCSICYSWTTGKSFGYARTGRVYPPNFCMPVAAGSSISGANAAALANAAKVLIDRLTVSGSDYQFEPHVMSKTGGVHNKITGVRVGNIIDVQRKRKNAVSETYSAVAL
jgi:hypothetical protein